MKEVRVVGKRGVGRDGRGGGCDMMITVEDGLGTNTRQHIELNQNRNFLIPSSSVYPCESFIGPS